MRKKSKKILIVVGVAFVLIILLGVLFYQPSREVNYFNSKELGLVKYSIFKTNFLSGLSTPTKQAFFSTATTSLGESVTVSDNIPVGYTSTYSTENVISAELYINLDGGNIAKIDILSKVPNDTVNPQISLSYTPTKEGLYDAFTIVKFKNGESARTDSVGTLRITSPAQACTLKSYYTGWITNKATPNGKVQSRTFYSVTSDCEFKVSGVENRIVCDSDYVVSGTLNKLATYTSQTCELANEPVVSLCDADVVETCLDNSTTVNQECLSGKLVSTGNSCPSEEVLISQNTQNTESPVMQGVSDQSNKTILIFEKYRIYFVYGGYALVFLIISFLAYTIMRRK